MPAAERWDRRILRAETLAADDETARPLLVMYASILRLQRHAAARLTQSAPRFVGVLHQDLPVLRAFLRPLLQQMALTGPPAITEQAAALLDAGDAAFDALLDADTGTAPNVFARIALQPYAEWLAAAGMRPLDLGPRSHAPEPCPVCGAAPLLSFLHPRAENDGSGRQLLCAVCATTWPFRRIRCAACGEEDERRLASFSSQAFAHIRIDACDTCGRYLKTIDLTRLGLAVPEVDEVAGASLDLWARDQGYEKVVLNVVGL